MAGVEPPDPVRMDDDLPLLEGPTCTASRRLVSNTVIRLRVLPIEPSQRYDVRSCEGGGSASDGGTESGKRVRFFDFSADESGQVSFGMQTRGQDGRIATDVGGGA